MFAQGSKGIRQWPINSCTSSIMMHKITHCRLKLVVGTLEHWTYKATNQNSLKSPKLLIQRIRNLYYKTLGTSVINSPLSPISLFCFIYYYIDALLMNKLVLVYIWRTSLIVANIKMTSFCRDIGIARTMADKLMYIRNDDTQKLPLLYLKIICWNIWTLNLMNQPNKINLSS